MMVPGKFYDAITKWHCCAQQAEKAEANRNYSDFQFAFREARRQFNVIREAISEGLHHSMPTEQREQLISTTRNWDRLTERIEVWKDEMAKEAETLRRKSCRNKKIAKGYGMKTNTSGQSFRLKAT